MHAAGRGAASSSSSVLMRTVMIFRRRWRHRWQHLFLVFSSSLVCSPSSLLFLRVFDVHWRVHFLALSNKVAFQVSILLVYTRVCLRFEVKRVTNIWEKKRYESALRRRWSHAIHRCYDCYVKLSSLIALKLVKRKADVHYIYIHTYLSSRHDRFSTNETKHIVADAHG